MSIVEYVSKKKHRPIVAVNRIAEEPIKVDIYAYNAQLRFHLRWAINHVPGRGFH